jgi:hypothetical protein
MSETTLSTLELTQLIGMKITDLFNEHLEAVKKCDYDQKLKDEFSALITELKSEFADVYDELQQKIDDHIGELVDYKSKILSDWLWQKMAGLTVFECDREADSILEI